MPGFLLLLEQAIRTGENPPPELASLWTRRAFWKNFGMKMEDIEEMPNVERELYIRVLQLEEWERKRELARAERRSQIPR
jgi:hypothetical protein